MAGFRSTISKVMAALRSRRGHNFLVFLAFLVLSTLLWFVMALNDEEQCDVRMPLVLTNVPDSVTIISTPPQAIAVSLRTRGSQRLKLAWSGAPKINVDFRIYRSGNALHLSNTDLKSLARNAVDGASIILVSPDSLNLLFTTGKGTKLPVIVDYSVTAGPKSSFSGYPLLSVDSVKVYSLEPLTARIEAVATEPFRMTGLNESVTRRLALVPPPGTRVVPDSVDVTFNVEPLILKSRMVTVETQHVPEDRRLITFPARVEVIYMISLSDFKNNPDPHMKVVADYSTINHANPTRNIRLKLMDVSANLQNVHLAADSAEYIIEQL